VKVWHVIAFIKEEGLPAAIDWLRERKYLPEAGKDYDIFPWPITCGNWSAEWYGVRMLSKG